MCFNAGLPFCIRVHQRLSVVLSSSILANASGAQMMVRSEIIRGLEKVGLVWNVKLPTERQLETRSLKGD